MVSISKEQVFKGAGLLLVGTASYWALNKFCGKRWKVLQHPACKVGVIATPLVLGMVYSSRKGFVAKLEDEVLYHQDKHIFSKKISNNYIVYGETRKDDKINQTIAGTMKFECCKMKTVEKFAYVIMLGKDYQSKTAKKLCEKVVPFLMKLNLTFRVENMPRKGKPGKPSQPTREKVIFLYQREQELQDDFWKAPIEGLKTKFGISKDNIHSQFRH